MSAEYRTDLRTGYTTGTCASAAALAALLQLQTGNCPESLRVPLPQGDHLDIPIVRCEPDGAGVRATVVKDGGDDPDATHGADIQAVVTVEPGSAPLEIRVDGGRGVGRATLPGLPVAVGDAAINPVPLQQIRETVAQGAREIGLETGHILVLVEVPNGEAIARRTLNPRLGIVGGISILGTQGIVKPYSHDSWKASIAEALDVARAQGLDHAVFTTGRRSERLYQATFPETPGLAMIQAADFFSFSMQAALERGFTEVAWSVFFGKLVKQAQGLPYTHARTYPVDFDRLAEWSAQAGVAPERLPEIRGANTARQVLAMLEQDPALPNLLDSLALMAIGAAESFADNRIRVSYAVFDFDDRLLCRCPARPRAEIA
ncbi:cobalt-precorrin-5B (C(1))-methyltransferase CbiD [Pseudodesulfovibrio tunisiensis]|uniref:cobalt-precorrin-5B (C(1))-methyltransferase CbiD n=1 Tax=Pseudodesulfovibrio tunisiensis TaxID=463192 RepID=UPI001FB1E4DC|nr:cobalt-precorrin-5B (C(1))-methyltransferase CbiD [Pseudodesulfovibrio tunisiensis]